jgi:hypothetical protein
LGRRHKGVSAFGEIRSGRSEHFVTFVLLVRRSARADISLTSEGISQAKPSRDLWHAHFRGYPKIIVDQKELI